MLVKGVFLVILTLQCFCSCFALPRTDPQVDRLIKRYWFQYKKIEVILAYLQIVHHVAVGLTWLKKRLHVLGLHRRGPLVHYSSVSRVQEAIEAELQGCNNNVGYRQMWVILKQKYGLVVKRSTVQMLLALLDPEGAKRRQGHRLRRRVYQNKGPDFVWHLDGYDKLKPYGFAIHGCIDGYSRRIIWLEVSTTNNDPNVILLLYLLAVLNNNGCPSIVRTDRGTENTSLAASHMALRHNHLDEFRGEKSFRYGSSTTNTRIESWWAQLRNSVTDWWINLFKDLIQEGSFNPQNETHRHCLAYVYGLLLKEALDAFKTRWNSHCIRRSRLAGCPPGSPDDLYFLPQRTGTRSYKQPLNFLVWSHCYLEYAYKPPPFYPQEFEAAATAILMEVNMNRQDITFHNARAVYWHLCNIMSS